LDANDLSPKEATLYIGMEVHKEATVIAVLNGSGKLVIESIVETKASRILQFIPGLRGELQVSWEEGSWAAWLYDLLQPQVARVLVCDPRRNALLKEGNKSDKMDARKLADLLRTGMLRPVYHGEHGLRTLRELGGCYQTLSQDLNRVMNRIKALYRGRSIPCGGTQVYAPRYGEEWLRKIEHVGVRRRAELLYQQLDGLQALRRTLRPELLAESRKHKAAKLLRQIPCIGPIRAARLIALMQTPHRFRSQRQLWTYSGLGIETRDSAQYRYVGGQLQRTKNPQQIRGLNHNHNHEMKEIFKAATTRASCGVGRLRDFYVALLAKGMKPEMAGLTLARKMAAIALTRWKKEERFDPQQLKPQAA
jgi:transposase